MLGKIVRSTNLAETAFEKVRAISRNVKRRQNGKQILCRSAVGLLEAEKGFKRIDGHCLLLILAAALEKEVTSKVANVVKMA